MLFWWKPKVLEEMKNKKKPIQPYASCKSTQFYSWIGKLAKTDGTWYECTVYSVHTSDHAHVWLKLGIDDKRKPKMKEDSVIRQTIGEITLPDSLDTRVCTNANILFSGRKFSNANYNYRCSNCHLPLLFLLQSRIHSCYCKEQALDQLHFGFVAHGIL